MNADYERATMRAAPMYSDLLAAPLLPMRGGQSHVVAPGIYVLYQAGRAVHVGRTRNLRKRLQGHCSQSHYHASYAFKRAREATGIKADYRPGNSRKVLAERADFRPVFLAEVDVIRGMQYRFLRVDNPIEQYLLELYAAMELGTSMDEFDTH